MEHNEQPSKIELPSHAGWEREMIEKLAFASLNEQQKARRWGNFFKLAMFAYLIGIFAMMAYPHFKHGMSGADKPHTAVINVQGVIAENEEANADAIIEGMRDAVKDEKTKGIILKINSPGGSPVQSAYVYDEIRRLKKEHPKLPIYAVVSDICASGGYFIASASDKIFVNQASLIGSIGVIMNGFGFVDVIKKVGVERRLLTAGAHKAMLDPFSPAKEDENAYMQTLLNGVHQQFIKAVRDGRGKRLIETKDTFSGLVWTGAEGVKLGLADGFGTVDSIAKEVIGAEETVDFTPQEQLFDKLAGKLGASFGHALSSAAQSISLQ
jgi:protease IV